MPAAEVTISENLVRALVTTQAKAAIPDVAGLPLRKAAEGWDCQMWRMGADLAVRLPRRALAAPLMRHEQQALPGIAARVESTGVRVPSPIVAGAPGHGYPWAWSVVPWFEGSRGLDVTRTRRAAWAEPLAAALAALHTDAPDDHPVNPMRGVPLSDRADAVAERLALLRRGDAVSRELAGHADAAWRQGLVASAWQGPAVWIHGDLHPGNLVIRHETLAAIIDFGDVTAGDPAYDLAIAWLAFDPAGRMRFRAATGVRYDDATWVRARAWAAAGGVLLLTHSDDNPDYARLGRATLEEIALGGDGRERDLAGTP